MVDSESPRLQFRARLHARGPAAAVILDDEQLAAIGGGRRTLPVQVTINGQTFPARIARMGGETLIGFNKQVRTACGVEAGQEIDILIVAEEAPRTVDVPDALRAALAEHATAHAAFDALSYTHRKEFARWISEAKKDETRERRVAETLRMLQEGRPPR